MDGVTDRPESFEQLNHVFDRKAPVHGCRCVRGLLFMNSQDNSGKYIDFFTVKLLTSDEAKQGKEQKMQKILYVEDDLSLIDGLQYTLEASGYMVDNAKTVKEALALFRKNTYDLLLLDVTLPDGTGFDVCKEVRNSSTVPIIFLTASDQEISIVRGLDMGADDYITKPFKLNELLSRIKAILRRSLQFSKADTLLEANGVRVDTAERLVWKNGKPLDLPLVEYKLLCLFMQNPNHLMPREMILDRMWDGNGNFVDDNTLSVYIRRLRNKIEDTPNQPKYLLTERGIGYKWVVE